MVHRLFKREGELFLKETQSTLDFSFKSCTKINVTIWFPSRKENDWQIEANNFIVICCVNSQRKYEHYIKKDNSVLQFIIIIKSYFCFHTKYYEVLFSCLYIWVSGCYCNALQFMFCKLFQRVNQWWPGKSVNKKEKKKVIMVQ